MIQWAWGRKAGLLLTHESLTNVCEHWLTLTHIDNTEIYKVKEKMNVCQYWLFYPGYQKQTCSLGISLSPLCLSQSGAALEPNVWYTSHTKSNTRPHTYQHPHSNITTIQSLQQQGWGSGVTGRWESNLRLRWECVWLSLLTFFMLGYQEIRIIATVLKSIRKCHFILELSIHRTSS